MKIPTALVPRTFAPHLSTRSALQTGPWNSCALEEGHPPKTPLRAARQPFPSSLRWNRGQLRLHSFKKTPNLSLILFSTVFIFARYDSSYPQRPHMTRKKCFCLSIKRSEESLFLFMELNRREIPRFARNDKINYFFRSLFSLWVLVLARTNPRRLKPVPLQCGGPS